MESSSGETALFAFLESLGIETRTHRHTPVFTVEEAQAVRASLPEGPGQKGGHAKNLFVRDHKKRRALVVVEENRRVDLKALAASTGMGRLSFASADSLMTILGITPGAVTPFALINAKAPPGAEPPLRVILDKAMLASSPLHFHPLHNAATTAIVPDDLIRFIRACGYEPEIVDLDA